MKAGPCIWAGFFAFYEGCMEMESLTKAHPATANVEICWLNPEKDNDLALPAYETSGSAGMDVCAAVETSVVIEPG